MVMFCSNFMIWGVVFVGGGWNSDKHIPSRMLLSALTRVKVLYLCCFDLLNGTNEKLHFPSFFFFDFGEKNLTLICSYSKFLKGVGWLLKPLGDKFSRNRKRGYIITDTRVSSHIVYL